MHALRGLPHPRHRRHPGPSSHPALARDGVETRRYDTRRIEGEPPRLDGRVDDPAWEVVPWSGDFVQREPTDGAPPSQQSQFKVLYDDEALYFAFRLFDDPALVTRHLARRDWFPGDWIEVNIDSRADERTAYSFTLSLSGTRGDEYISDDGNNWNGNWDPVWEGATAIDDQGWTAETRIPLSQLRFDPAKGKPWGLQVHRRHFRAGERSTWQEIPRDTRGWVSKFGDLCGIENLQPGRRAEILPYVVAQHDRYAPEPGNPFRDGTDNSLSAGLDAKLGLGNDFSLDLTVNPDFGQVEADPSEVNLTAFETFFPEKRPFFIEGADVLNLPLAPAIAGGAFTRDRLFYSRRIGKSPSYSPELGADEFADVPDQTSILGAAKLSGKTAGGLSVGLLESVTARERAEIASPDGDREETVEPLTNYMVGRVTQDLRGGQTVIGGMLTSVLRDIDDPYLEFLERRAWAGGVDLQHYFHDRDYRLEVRLLGSHLRGSETAILGAQTASARYFQRPDNDYADVDSSRTTLSGHAGSAMLTRTGNNSNFMYQVGGAWRSPGFEINDLGFMRSADQINQFAWAGYSRRNPFWIFNYWQTQRERVAGLGLRRHAAAEGREREHQRPVPQPVRRPPGRHAQLRSGLEHRTARRPVVALARRLGVRGQRRDRRAPQAAGGGRSLGLPPRRGQPQRLDHLGRSRLSSRRTACGSLATRRTNATTTRCSTCRPAAPPSATATFSAASTSTPPRSRSGSTSA